MGFGSWGVPRQRVDGASTLAVARATTLQRSPTKQSPSCRLLAAPAARPHLGSRWLVGARVCGALDAAAMGVRAVLAASFDVRFEQLHRRHDTGGAVEQT